MKPTILCRLLNPFLTLSSVIFIRNHENIHFDPPKVPIISQHIVAITPSLNDGLDDFLTPTWIPNELVTSGENITSIGINLFPCASIYFIDEVHLDNHTLKSKCSTINSTLWVTKIRPWQWTIIIDLFPPTAHLTDDLSYPHPMKENINQVPPTPVDFDWLPSLPSYNYFVYDDITMDISKDTLYCWVKVMARLWFKSGKLANYGKYFAVNIANNEIIVSRINPINLVYTNVAKWGNLDRYSQIFEPIDVELRQAIPWSLELKLYPPLTSPLSSCHNDISLNLKSIGRILVSKRNPQDRIYMAYMHILQLLMGNFTYVLELNWENPEKSTECRYPGVIATNPDTNLTDIVRGIKITVFDSHQLPVHANLIFHNPYLNLGFVVCGDRGSSQLAFKELLGTFDLYVWTSIYFVCMLSACILKKFKAYSSDGYKRGMFEILKELYEQGDPFSASILKWDHVRVVVAGVLMVGMILSTAYKSSNIYNMTRPRIRNTFETFDQIIHANISILTRIKEIYFETDRLESGRTLNVSSDWYFKGKQHDFEMALGSKTSTWVSLRLVTEVASHLRASGKSIWNDTIVMASKVLSVAFDDIQRPLNEIILSNFSEPFPSGDSFRNEYYQIEEDRLLGTLSKCNKTAILLPDVVSSRYKKILRQSPYFVNVDVGKQKFSEVIEGITFQGHLSGPILVRVSTIKQSGIVEWWERLAGFDTAHNRDRGEIEELSPIKMKGQIFIVFVVLGVGVLISVVGSFLEILYILLSSHN